VTKEHRAKAEEHGAEAEEHGAETAPHAPDPCRCTGALVERALRARFCVVRPSKKAPTDEDTPPGSLPKRAAERAFHLAERAFHPAPRDCRSRLAKWKWEESGFTAESKARPPPPRYPGRTLNLLSGLSPDTALTRCQGFPPTGVRPHHRPAPGHGTGKSPALAQRFLALSRHSCHTTGMQAAHIAFPLSDNGTSTLPDFSATRLVEFASRITSRQATSTRVFSTENHETAF